MLRELRVHITDVDVLKECGVKVASESVQGGSFRDGPSEFHIASVIYGLGPFWLM